MRKTRKKKCLSPCARIVGLASSVPSASSHSSMLAAVGFVAAGPCGVSAACQLAPPSSTRAVVCFFHPLLQQPFTSNGLAALRPLPRSAARRSTAAATSAAAAAISRSSGLRMVAERQEGMRVGLAAAADMSLTRCVALCGVAITRHKSLSTFEHSLPALASVAPARCAARRQTMMTVKADASAAWRQHRRQPLTTTGGKAQDPSCGRQVDKKQEQVKP
jgi:hypothetical protein